jgi:phenylpropionate dioxygenase-like ring-hydroxylating dioxygenase large terminal subunit
MSVVTKRSVEQRLNAGLPGQWYVIAKSSQIQPGAAFAAQALGQKLVLWRTAEGVLHCVEDYCPHRGAPLSRGQVRGENIGCAYHGVQVDGDGVVAKVPALPGCLLEGRKELRSFTVEEHRDGVFCWFPSIDQPEPLPLALPYEFSGDDYAMFLTTSLWEQNYRYAIENIADPMHGPYLHGDTFTLSEGSREDTVKLTKVKNGFTVARVQQQGENFDWAEIIVESSAPHCRVDIPYPLAGGPGGIMRVVTFITPVDERHCRIFFWRCRKVSGLELQTWRFLFRTTFEPRHWAVLEQDRAILAAMPANARDRERLYQHDIGITRLRQILSKRARAQLEAEQAARESAARPAIATSVSG